ncbi:MULTISPECIES: YfcC family protein [Bacteroides]|uniref:YfcC family protein n=1 Tax=Bacteroides TaxID=816 RepID=UPI001DC768EB|nr:MULTISPECIES: Na+/H+ antiporter NhaC family protein [Bacteroides]HJD92644.1 TIGR00366 family protein [Bacteroides coprosuis]
MTKRIPHAYTIISVAILLCAVLSWVIPAGEYDREQILVNGVEKTVIVENSFHLVEQSPQTWQVFSSLLVGFERQAGIIAFLLIMGGAFQVMNVTRSIDIGIFSFLNYTKKFEKHKWMQRIGVNNLIIVSVMLLFSLFGAVFGMSEETIAFTILVMPLAIRMGYDSIVGVCMVYVAAHIGFSGAMLNPFTVGIAQGFSDLPLFSGIEYRLFCWVVLTTLIIFFVLRYAAKIKKNPKASPMYEIDSYWRSKEDSEDIALEYKTTRSSKVVYGLILIALVLFSIQYPYSTFELGGKSSTLLVTPVLTVLYALLGFVGLRKSNHFFILTILAFTIIFLIVGVMAHGWYLPEISGIFLAMGVMAGFADGLKTDSLIKHFQDGAKDMLSAAIVVGLAGGIIQILEDGSIIDPILHGLASLLGETSKVFSLTIMYIIQSLINLIIPSGTAKAALTMPIMAPFSDVIGISRQATVMAFQFGDGFTNMVTPTSAVLLGVLGIAKIPYGVWLKWFFKYLLFFILVGFLLLIPTVTISLNGF